ncbi:MAG: hypothetical protein ACK4IC_05135 [Erythrobacter sp.]
MAEKRSEPVVSTRMLVFLLVAWTLLVVSILAWQAYAYRGPFAAMAEWQFRQWDKMFPVATIILVTFLLQIPLLILIGLRLRQRRRKFGPAGGALVIRREKLAAGIVGFISAIALLAAVMLTILGFTIGGISEKASITASINDGKTHVNQMVRMRGLARFDRIGFYRERVLITGRDLWVAPLLSSTDDRTIRYFVEVPRGTKASPAELRNVTGIVRRSAVPGGLRKLYEYEGYSVPQPAYVLFTSRASARWPFFNAAIDLVIVALVGLLVVILLRSHSRQISKRMADPGEPASL